MAAMSSTLAVWRARQKTMHIAPSVIAIPAKQVQALVNPTAHPLRQIPLGHGFRNQNQKDRFPIDCRQTYQNLGDFIYIFEHFRNLSNMSRFEPSPQSGCGPRLGCRTRALRLKAEPFKPHRNLIVDDRYRYHYFYFAQPPARNFYLAIGHSSGQKGTEHGRAWKHGSMKVSSFPELSHWDIETSQQFLVPRLRHDIQRFPGPTGARPAVRYQIPSTSSKHRRESNVVFKFDLKPNWNVKENTLCKTFINFHLSKFVSLFFSSYLIQHDFSTWYPGVCAAAPQDAVQLQASGTTPRYQGYDIHVTFYALNHVELWNDYTLLIYLFVYLFVYLLIIIIIIIISCY